MQTTRWWWIRHAPVTDDGGRVYGQRDLPANTSNAAAFAALAAAMPGQAVWVTSHLQRTDQTARAIAAAGADFAEPLVEPDLAEQHFGDWQGEIRTEVYARHGDPHSLWLVPPHVRAPGGESFGDVCARVAPAIERLTQAHAGRDIVAVAHGGTIRAALQAAMALSLEKAVAFNTDNLSLTRIDHLRSPKGGEAWRVVGVNLSPTGLAHI
jgi:broad specificity phosphatase PhoE